MLAFVVYALFRVGLEKLHFSEKEGPKVSLNQPLFFVRRSHSLIHALEKQPFQLYLLLSLLLTLGTDYTNLIILEDNCILGLEVLKLILTLNGLKRAMTQ